MDENLKNIEDAINTAITIIGKREQESFKKIETEKETLAQLRTDAENATKQLKTFLNEVKEEFKTIDNELQNSKEAIAELYKSKREQYFQESINGMREIIFNVKYKFHSKYLAISFLIITNMIAGLSGYFVNNEKNYQKAELKVNEKIVGLENKIKELKGGKK